MCEVIRLGLRSVKEDHSYQTTRLSMGKKGRNLWSTWIQELNTWIKMKSFNTFKIQQYFKIALHVLYLNNYVNTQVKTSLSMFLRCSKNKVVQDSWLLSVMQSTWLTTAFITQPEPGDLELQTIWVCNSKTKHTW